MPYNPMTSNIDTAAVSADGATYTDPKWMVTIVTGSCPQLRPRPPLHRKPAP